MLLVALLVAVAGSADPIARAAAGLVPVVARQGVPPVRQRLEDRMRALRVPGVSVAVAEGGRIAWARGFGVRRVGGGDPVTPATPFQAGSIGKAVTATATLVLVDRGKLRLDEDVDRTLRSWKLPASGFTATEKVTLRRLMSHTAGINVPSFRGYTAVEPLPTIRQILDGLPPAQTVPVRVEAVPGSVCRYSGGGVTVEQLVLMDVTGQPFPALMAGLVLRPLGMADSTFEERLPPALAARASAAHDATGAVIAGGHLLHPEQAAAGLWSTPSDLLRWAIEIAAARAGRSTRLLSQATATAMLTVVKRPVGLGPFLAGSGRAFSFAHRGWNPGFHARVVYFPETGQGAAVMVNGDGGRVLVDEILLAVGAEQRWPGTPPAPIVPADVDEATRAGVAGTYQGMAPHAIRVTARVTRAGARLLVDAPALGGPDELVFLGPREVISLDRGDRFTVVPGADGRASALVFGDMTMARVEGRPQPGPGPYPPLPGEEKSAAGTQPAARPVR